MTGEQQPVPQLDLLGLALGVEFNECSIAAAELNEQVARSLGFPGDFDVERARDTTINHYSELVFQKRYIVGARQDQKREYVVLKINPVIVEGISDDGLPLALVQPLEEDLHETRVKSGWFRHVVNVQTDVHKTDEPLLVAMLDEEIMLPLASFARREDGTCSYVQLGSEMKDDNLFVVASDESTSRHAVIEAIRTIIKTGRSGYGAPYGNVEQTDLAKLITQEFSQQAEEIARAREPYLARTVFNFFDNSRTVHRQLVVMNEAEALTNNPTEQVDEVTIFGGYRQPDGRVVKITLSRSVDNPELISLLASTRGNISLPLAVFDKSSAGTVDFLNLNDSLSTEQRQSLVALLSDRLNFRKQEFPEVSEDLRYSVDNISKDEMMYAQLLARRGALRSIYKSGDSKKKLNEIASPKRDNRYIIHPSDENVSDVEAFLDNTELEPEYEINNRPFKLAKYRLDHPDSKQLAFFELLGLQERLEFLIGPTSSEEESLLRNLFYLANRKDEELSGVIQNVSIGNTNGSALISARITNVGTIFDVSISARPKAINGEPLRPILNLRFDASQPLFDHSVNKKDQLKAKNKLTEIDYILSHL